MEPSASDGKKNGEVPSGSRVKEKPRVPAGQVLPSDRHAFEVVFDVLRRFVTVTHNGNQAVESSRVEGEGVPVQAGSLNVRFLRSIGLLEVDGRGLYKPTSDAIQFVLARSVSDEKARPILRRVLEESWFARTARSVLNSTTPMTETQFVGELAIAGQTDREKKEAALKTVVEYLVYSGMIVRDKNGLLMSETGVSAASLSAGPLAAPDAARTQPLFGVPVDNAPPAEGWHTLQTEDFSLRIRSDMDAVADLEAHLDLLKRKVERSQSARGPKSLAIGKANGGETAG